MNNKNNIILFLSHYFLVSEQNLKSTILLNLPVSEISMYLWKAYKLSKGIHLVRTQNFPKN